MDSKIKDGNVLIYNSYHSKNYISKEIYTQYKGIPLVVKLIEGSYYLFWKDHKIKSVLNPEDKLTMSIYCPENFKVIGNIDMKRKGYKDISGYDLVNNIEDFHNL